MKLTREVFNKLNTAYQKGINRNKHSEQQMLMYPSFVAKALESFTVLFTRAKARVIRAALKSLRVSRKELISLENGEYLGQIKKVEIAKYSSNSFIELSHGRDGNVQIFGLQARSLVRVEGVVLDTKSGMIFDGKKRILEESSSWPGAQLILNSVPKPKLAKPFNDLNDREILLLPGNSFYHWLIEDLPPLLFALEKLTDPVLLVNNKAPKYVMDFKETLQLDVVSAPRYIQLDRYCFTTKNPSSGWPEPVDVMVLRQHFAKVLEQAKKRSKVYVSRLNSSRSPEFESELINLLRQDGWEILFLELMELTEQIKSIAGAEVVCGVGGAGLSHIVWMNENSRVIELSPSWYVPCFARLSGLLKLNYNFISFQDEKASTIFVKIASLIQ
jgi:hypothetical protein